MYYVNHYVIDWDKVQTLDDLKRLLAAMQFTFEPTCEVGDIIDMLRLEPKRPASTLLLSAREGR